MLLWDLLQWQHCWQQLRFIEQSIAARQFFRLARGGPARQFCRLAHREVVVVQGVVKVLPIRGW